MPHLQSLLLPSLLLILLGIISTARGTDFSKNYFTSPASNTGINPVWTLGDTEVISWETTLGVFEISIWQESLVQVGAASQGNVYEKIHQSDKVTNITWTVQLYGFDLNYSNVFFFWMNPDGPNSFVSSYFNITEPTADTDTDTSTSTKVEATGLDSPPTTSVSDSNTSSPSSDTPPSNSSSSGLSTTAKIALGIGLGIGIPLLIAMIALVWLKARHRHPPNNTIATSNKTLSMMQQAMPPSSPKEVHGTAYCSELPSGQEYPELPDQEYPQNSLPA
ncbi:hypothetical protein FQN54_001792 [Arachnomyces sp. PD_36]|nr:hypothetical protein FQN54_001792 [Arachnomyces sp. PD_36]